MRDWKAISQAVGLPLTGKQLDVLAPLDSLEEIFRPLVQNLPPELEPVFQVSPEVSE
ncbi:MAG TPA: hypothetical protein VHW24_15080 [Bryobacteraceae bacterium]|jgi:hypothetical protein|nr:hypothetical protein [Bryobacteraceae bacterium]